MEIAAPTVVSTSLATLASVQGRESWQVGQLLHAVVLHVKADLLTLRIDHHTLTARAVDSSLKPGQALWLEVVSARNPVTLKTATPDVAPPPETAAVHAALRTALPLQRGWGPLIATLTALTDSKTQSVPPTVKETLHALLTVIPTAQQLTEPQTLKTYMQNSGLFLENRLVSALATHTAAGLPLQADIKALLTQFIAALKPLSAPTTAPLATTATTISTPPLAAAALIPIEHESSAALPTTISTTPFSPTPPPPWRGVMPAPQAATPVMAPVEWSPSVAGTLGVLAEGALARLQLTQLANLPPAEGAATAPLLMEIPVRHATGTDVVQTAWEFPPEKSSATTDASAAPPHTVTLALDTLGLGPTQCRITLSPDNQISVHWRAADPATVARLHAALEDLHADLTQAGLSIASLQCTRDHEIKADMGPGRAAPPLINLMA